MHGERLKERRLAAGLTLAELSTRIGTTATQLSRLENGKRGLTYAWTDKIDAALGGVAAPAGMWKVAECPATNREARDALLNTGWEPFAVQGETMWLRRQG